MSDYQTSAYNVPNSTSTVIQNINNLGEIVGTYFDASGKFYAFTELGGNVQSFNDQNGTDTEPTALNASGTVIGTYFPNVDTTSTRSFVFQNGSFSDIPIPNAAVVSATGINDAGVIVGYYSATAGSSSDVGFIDTNGQISSFTAPNSTSTTVDGINNEGAIFGSFSDGQGGHAFVKTGNAFQVINAPGSVGGGTAVTGVNDAGEIAGDYTDASGTTHGFVDNNGSFTTIDEPGATFTQINGINSSGQVLGVSIDASRTYHVFVYKDGAYTPVTDLQDQGVTFGGPQAINDQGTVVGYDVGPSSVSGFIAATPVATPDAISISPQTTYENGVFTITGTASSTVGVQGVEITALIDGDPSKPVDLGAATVNPDGTFSFMDDIGSRLQGFITATETDGAGVQTQAAFRPALQGGKSPHMDRYTVTPTEVTYTGSTYYETDGSHRVTVTAPGQVLGSSFFDTFDNNGAASSTFVFDPGFGEDAINLFRVDGADHDSLSFKSSDFGATPADQLASVLSHSKNTAAGLLITDPTASSPGPGGHDKVLLKGITKGQLAANQADIAFHA